MGVRDDSGEGLTNVGFLSKIAGTRIPEMDRTRIPQGWVVDARGGDPLWEFMKPGVIPLRPKEGIFGIQLREVKKANDQLKKWQVELHDPEAFVVMVPHSDTDSQWWVRPLRPADLKRKNPELLLDEALDAIKQGKYVLADALETAYRARTGAFDLH